MGLALTATTRVILIIVSAFCGGVCSQYVDVRVAVGLLVISICVAQYGVGMRYTTNNARRGVSLRGILKRQRTKGDVKLDQRSNSSSLPVQSDGDQLRGVHAKDAWRKDVNSEVVAEAWFSFAGHIVQEFIYDTWYSHLTPDMEFPAEVRALLNGAFGRLAKRARTHVCLHRLCSELVEMLIDQIDIFRDAKQTLVSENDWNNDAPQLDEKTETMLRRILARDSNLHPGFENPKAHYAVLKHMSDSVVSFLADPIYSNRVLSRVVSREMLSACVLRKVLELCSPYNFQKWLSGLLGVLTRQGNGVSSTRDVSRPSSELRGVWNQTTKVLHTVELEKKVVDAVSSDDDEDTDNAVLDSTDDGPSTQTIFERITSIGADLNRQQSKAGKFKGRPSARVSSAEINSSEARDFVVYRIRVGDDRGEWTISRRYRHFESLHRTIRGTKGYNLSLPGKRLFGHDFSPEYIESRRRALDDYVVKLLQNPDLYSLEFVWEFFRKRSERFQIQSNSSFLSDTVKRTVVGVTRDACHTARTGAKSAAQALNVGKKKPKKKDRAKGQAAIQLNIRVNDDGRGGVQHGALVGAEEQSSSELNDDSDAESTSVASPSSISAPLYDLVNCVFSLETRGFFTRQIFQISKQFLLLVFGDAVDEYLNSRLTMLQQESTIARLIAKLQGFLWPGGKFAHRKNDIVDPASEEKYVSLPDPGDDFEEIRRVLKEQLSSGSPVTVSKLVGRMAYFDGVNDILELLQSSTMTMQIGYGFLELILAHLFPEIKHELS